MDQISREQTLMRKLSWRLMPLLMLARPGNPTAPVRIGHPLGVIVVAADGSAGANGPEVAHATVFRTARRLFEGRVFYRDGFVES
jgi:2-methylaconitate cis-trans-isomerase PrpF